MSAKARCLELCVNSPWGRDWNSCCRLTQEKPNPPTLELRSLPHPAKHDFSSRNGFRQEDSSPCCMKPFPRKELPVGSRPK